MCLKISFPFTQIAIFFLLTSGGHKALAQTSKSHYSLLNPTPKEQMRDLSTDRPDKTESPFTVDAGHFQIETDIVTYTEDRVADAGVETKTNSFGALISNLKVGLTNSLDFQLILTPHQSEEVGVADASVTRKNGIGDTIVRLKYNLIGNDAGDIALGLMPFLKLPTNSGGLGNKKVEGGLILPIGISLPSDWGLGLMAQVNRNKNEADEKYHTEFVSSITLGHDIVDRLGGYIEFYSLSSDEDGSGWIATADVGFTYGLTNDFQVDLGVNLGLTKDADDLNPFLGASLRI